MASGASRPRRDVERAARLPANVVSTIAGAGQEIALHLHPDWLTHPRCGDLPEFAGPLLHQYGDEAQGKLVRTGLQLPTDAGAPDICAFRAGSGREPRDATRTGGRRHSV
jgi:hypothetical protein